VLEISSIVDRQFQELTRHLAIVDRIMTPVPSDRPAA
jgi:hypothetical protein